jgi:hypothetical protein
VSILRSPVDNSSREIRCAFGTRRNFKRVRVVAEELITFVMSVCLSFFPVVCLSVYLPVFPYVSARLILGGKKKRSRYRPEQALRGSRGIALLFPDLGARSWCVVSITPRPLYPQERPGTHCTGGWVGPRTGLDVCEISRPHRDFFSEACCIFLITNLHFP